MERQGQSEEITDAIQAANVALEHLEAAAKELRSASRWGIYDMFAGGFIATAVKHGRLSRAQEEIEEAKSALWRFARQLNYTQGTGGLNVEVDGFLQFADYFFDGMVSDWLVQSKIDESRHQVDAAIRQAERVRDRLCQM